MSRRHLPFRHSRGHARGLSASPYTVEPLESRTLLSLPPFGPQFRVNTVTPQTQDTSNFQRSVAMDAVGDFVVVWQSPDVSGTGMNLYAQLFDPAGTKRGGEIQVTPSAQTGPLDATVSMDAIGNFVIAWATAGTAPSDVQMVQFGNVGNRGGYTVLGQGHRPSLAMDGDGDFEVMWLTTTGGVDGKRYEDPGVLAGVSLAQPGPVSSVAIDADAEGEFVTAWGNAGTVYYFSTYPSGLPAIATQSWATGGTQVSRPDVGVDAAGNFVITCSVDNQVLARRVNPWGTLLGPVVVVNTSPIGAGAEPSIAMNSAGNSVIAWQDANGNPVAQSFDADLNKLGSQFALSAAPTQYESVSQPKLAMDEGGNLAAVWSASVLSAGDVDVYARLFGTPNDGSNVASGHVFHDLNFNDTRDAGEPGLSDQIVYRDGNGNLTRDTGTYTSSRTLADPFFGMPLGTARTRLYLGPGPGTAVGSVITKVTVTLDIRCPHIEHLIVRVISPGGRLLTIYDALFDRGFGPDLLHTVFDDSGDHRIGNDFDPDYDHHEDTYRPIMPLSGFAGEVLTDKGYWMLQIDDRGSDPGRVIGWSVGITYSEPFGVSDGSGNYSVTLPSGTSTLRQVPAPPLQLMTNQHLLTFVGGGNTASGLDFGNGEPGVIGGYIFHDLNGNGTWDAGASPAEPMLDEGWTVYADLNNNGAFDPVEPSAHPAPLLPGVNWYFILGVPLNTPLVLHTVPPAAPTAPWGLTASPGPVTLTKAGFDSAVPAAVFGAFRRGSISGVKFNDLNANGARDVGEPGLANWRIFQDLNGNGVYDNGAPRTFDSTDVPKEANARTAAQSVLQVGGFTDAVTHLGVTLDLSAPIDGTVTATLFDARGHSAILFEDYPAGNGDLHNTTFDDVADLELAEGMPPYTGSFRPAQLLADLLRDDANGAWTLEVVVESVVRLDHATLNAWSLAVTTLPDPSTFTDANGAYSFASLLPGNYTMGEVSQLLWRPTLPPAGMRTVAIVSDRDVVLDFGDRSLAPTLRVARVFLGGPELSGEASEGQRAFRNAAGVDGRYGYPVPAGNPQLRALPWLGGINRVAIEFDHDVRGLIDGKSLQVSGASGKDYKLGDFIYDPETFTASWTLPSPATADRLRLVMADVKDLDGDWTNPGPTATPRVLGTNFPSGDGVAGGVFDFRINTLAADATGDGTVNVFDLADVKRRLNRRPGDAARGGSAYSPFADVNGDGVVNGLDASEVRLRTSRRLPAAIATMAGTAAVSVRQGVPLRDSSVRRQLFSSAPLLG